MCNFRHIKRDIKLTVHCDDFLVVADEEQLHWLNNKMQEEYEIKFQVMGPEKHLSQDVKILNRTLRWTQVGIEYEADLKHAGLIVKERKTPGITQGSKALEKEKEDVSNEEQTKFRSVAARINLLATDRADLHFASKDLCRRVACPDKSDWEKARRIARYFMHRPRAVQVFHFEDESEQMQGFADADWAGERPEMKSTSGGLLMWESSLLRSWSSTQNTIALSSAESELYAMSKIRSDASAALGIAYRRGLAGKTRHVQVQYLWIQQEVANEHVKIQKVLGTDNPR